MIKVCKIANISLIFTLIGVFLCSNMAYSLPDFTLRPPIQLNKQNQGFIKSKRQGQTAKELTYQKIEDLFGHLDKSYTSPEQEKTYYQRVRAALGKLEALEQGNRLAFQDEDLFRTRGKKPLSRNSFDALVSICKDVNIQHSDLLYAVLGLLDVGKIIDFKKDPRYKDLNFANHPETGAEILKDKSTFSELGFSSADEELALTLVQQHGFIGQSKRGEVTDEIFKPILQLAIDRKDPDILKPYLLVNIIDTSVVREGVFSEEFFKWFFTKHRELEKLVKKAIEKNKTAGQVLEQRNEVLFSEKQGMIGYVMERLNSIRPQNTKKEILESVERVFEGLPEAKEEFFNLLSRQINSVSLWYPEMSFSWLDSIDSEIKFLYIAVKLSELKTKKRQKPIDINFYAIAKEVNRRDESRLNEENRDYIRKVFAGLDIKNFIKPDELQELFKSGINGLQFEFDEKNNSLYPSFDPFSPLGLTQTQANKRIKELERGISGVTEKGPILFIKKTRARNPRIIGVFAISSDPFQRTHRALIEKALKEYDLDEIVLVASKEHISKEEFGASLAERVFILEQALKDIPRVSVAISQSGRFMEMAKYLRRHYSNPKFYFMMGFDNFEQMFDEDKSGNTKKDLHEFFRQNRLIVSPRGYATKLDTNRILIEQEKQEYSSFIYPLMLPREYRFDSSTEARRLLRENIPENKLLSLPTIRIVKALGLYARKRGEVPKVFEIEPTKIIFVNLTSPRHRIISEPQGLNALMGDMRREFGESAIVSSIDTQFGMTAEEVVEELKRQEPDTIGLSAQLESSELLFEILDLIKVDRYFKKRRIDILIGSNLPTNENKEILARPQSQDKFHSRSPTFFHSSYALPPPSFLRFLAL